MKKINQKAFAPVEVLVVVLILIVVAFIGYTAWSKSNNSAPESQAASRIARTTRSLYMDWRLEGGGKYSATLQSSDGWFCVESYLDDYNGFGVDYRQYLKEKQGSGWVTRRQSKRYDANGNRDANCWGDRVTQGRRYRIEFNPEQRTFMHGNTKIYNYRAWR